MKKFFRFLIAALSVATIAMTLTSCSAGGDGTEGADGDIIGSWEYYDGLSYRILFQFRPDGTVVMVSMHELTDEHPEVVFLTWSMSGDRLTIVYDESYEEKWIIKTLTKKELFMEGIIHGGTLPFHFYRVADSVVNEYIEKYGKK